jgi:hypothetical protein
MMTVLMVAGIGLILIGLGAIGYGIPVKEFGFGNTLILSGAIAACTGVIVLALHAAVRELKSIAPAGREPASAPLPLAALKRPVPPPDGERPDNSAGDDVLFTRDRPAPRAPADPEVVGPESAMPPWQQDVARERARQRAAAPAAEGASAPPAEPPSARPEGVSEAAAPEPSSRGRRSLLFSSSRRERERAALSGGAAGSDADVAADQQSGSDPTRNAFDDAWPEPDRLRGEPSRRLHPSDWGLPARPESATSAAEATEKFEPGDAPASEDEAEVTLLKSGEVDGMAYSLYSDGSIEARMPEGMMRFASIDELRSYLDQRS